MRESVSSVSRFAWLDTLRVLAGVCIVALHSSSDPAGNPFPGYPVSERIAPVLFRSVIYIARTELFMIISLFLLIMAMDRRPRPYSTMVREQARRLLLPFCFWVVFYAFYRLIKAHHFGYADAMLAQLQDPWNWVGYFVLGNVQYHMHFLPTLFGMVLLYPAYRIAVQRPEVGIVVILCLWAKLTIDQWTYATLAKTEYLEYVVRFVKIITYGGYGIVAASFYGMLKKNFDPDTGQKIFGMVLLLGIILYMVKLVYAYQIITTGTWAFTFTPGYWADYLMPTVLFLGVMSLRHKTWPVLFTRIAPFSFGIYLTHPIVMDAVEIMIAPWNLAPWQMVAIKFSLAFTGALIIVMTISRIPFLMWTIGLSSRPKLPGTGQAGPVPVTT